MDSSMGDNNNFFPRPEDTSAAYTGEVADVDFAADPPDEQVFGGEEEDATMEIVAGPDFEAQDGAPQPYGSPNQPTTSPWFFVSGDGDPAGSPTSDKFADTGSPVSEFSGDRTGSDRDVPLPETLVTDAELAHHLTTGADALGLDPLNRVLAASERLAHGGETVDAAGRPRWDERWTTKRLLAEVPAYAAVSTQVGLTNEEAGDLAAQTVGHVQNHWDQAGEVVANLRNALSASARQGDAPHPEALKAELTAMTAEAGDRHVVNQSLGAFAAARNLGLSTGESAGLVREYMATDGDSVASGIVGLTEALRTLSTSGASLGDVRTVIGGLVSLPPGQRDAALNAMKNTLVYDAPAKDVTPAELMRGIGRQIRGGVPADAALSGAQAFVGQKEPLDLNTAADPGEARDRRFTAKEGPLEHAKLSYQTRRSLNDGVRDLERLARAQSLHGDVVAEGRWVYDPLKRIWFCLGGETFTDGTQTLNSHVYIPYPVDHLSDDPHSFIVRPGEFTTGLGSRVSQTIPTDEDFQAIAHQFDMTEGRGPAQTFIVHPLGITQVTCPPDSRTIREVGKYVDETVTDMFRAPNLGESAARLGEGAIVDFGVRLIGETLPPGFGMSWHPPGADLQQILRGQQARL